MSSSSQIGRIFSLLSAAFFGISVGIYTERAGSKSSQQKEQQWWWWNMLRTLTSSNEMRTNEMEISTLSPFMQKIVSKGLPSDERVRFFDGFVASLNYERRVPNWVLEYIPHPTSVLNADEKKKEEGGGRRNINSNSDGDGDNESTGVRREGMKFIADTNIPEMFRVLPDDYSGGKQENSRGLSRGHLAAAQFHKKTTREMEQTFNMNANIVPQDMTMNAVDWLRLENLTKKLLRRYEGGLWIVTGPVFHPRYIYGDPRSWGWTESRTSSAIMPVDMSINSATNVIKKARKVVCYELVGKHDVAVPTHLFKVILGERADGSHEVAAFLMPNEPISTERPLLTYQVPVTEIEQKTGLQFFQNVPLTNVVSNMLPWNNNNNINNKGNTQGLDMLPNICRRASCEVRTTPLFQVYRSVAQLRAAQSLPELQNVFTTLIKEQQQQQQGGSDKPTRLETVVMREYEERKRELAG